MSNSHSALVLLNDLLFQVKIQQAARQAGVGAVFLNSAAHLLQIAGEQQPRVIILDLNYAAAEPVKLIRTLKTDTRTAAIPLLGYVSHVQVDLRAAAVGAGCDVVLARSAFVQNLPALLSQHAGDLSSD